MGKDEIRRELDELRDQVAALSAARKQQEAAASSNAGETEEVAQAAAQPPESAHAPDTEHKVMRQFDELLELLERELRDLPAITCLAVFSLGILLGRHLR